MHIDVRFLGGLEDTQSLREHVLRGVHFQLGRFGHALAEVRVRVADINGPKGGVDKRCQITVHGRAGSFTVEELRGDARAAIDVAMERTSRVVGRLLQRARAARRVTLWRPGAA